MKAKKHFGQHFLTNPDTAKHIVDALGDLQKLNVLEVGPGMGIITQFMVHTCKVFKAVEIDQEAQDYLERKFESIDLVKADFLTVDLRALFTTPFALIGNFPYNISSQIVFKIIENHSLVTHWVGMFQLEMGKRLLATPKDKKEYGILSAILPFYYTLEKVMTLAPGAFNPPPKVHSIVLKAKRVEHTFNCSEVLLKKVIKTAFGKRRKTLANSLSGLAPKEILNNHRFATLRPENLSSLDFEELTAYIEQECQVIP
jgi:16S rRNA (adenine1518-N6/adenine1519-N6)-dimethyltransferase